MLKIVFTGGAKAFSITAIEIFDSKKALLVLPNFGHKHLVHPKYVQHCKCKVNIKR